MKKNVLCLQISSKIADFEANCAKIKALLETYYISGGNYPDIIFLPELWTVGWDCDAFPKALQDNRRTLEFLSDIAKEYCVNIIGGSYLRETEDTVKNSCPIINRGGEICGFYDKIHLYSPDGEAKYIAEGSTPLIVDVEGLKIGLSICYDIRFPELFRSYIAGENKPELLVNLSAWPKTRRVQYDAMARSRAVENQAYFLALSQTGLIKDEVYNSGYSLFVHPLGETLQSLNEEEGYIFAEVDTEVVSNVRKTFPNLENKKVQNFGFTPKVIKVCGKTSVYAC